MIKSGIDCQFLLYGLRPIATNMNKIIISSTLKKINQCNNTILRKKVLLKLGQCRQPKSEI